MYSDIGQANQNKAYPQENNAQIQRPALAIVLENLREEVKKYSELTNDILIYCNSLQRMTSPQGPMEPMAKEKEEPGIVNLMQTEITRLTHTSSILQQCVRHLREVVGN